MTISYKAQLVHEFHALKALFLESHSQGDEYQMVELSLRLAAISEKLDNLEVSQ